MPVDTSALEKSFKSSETGQVVLSRGNWTNDPNAGSKLVLALIQANFPEYLSNSKAKMLPLNSLKDSSNLGEYSPWDNTIAFGKNLLGTGRNDYFTHYDKTNSNTVGFDSNDVLSGVALVLHELYHARSGGGVKEYQASLKGSGLSQEDLDTVLKTAGTEGKFPSLATPDTNEFLATAVPLLDMIQRNIQPQGKWAGRAQWLQDQIKSNPALGKFIDTQKTPEAPSTSQMDTTPNPIMQFLSNLFFSPNKSTAEKQDSGDFQ